MNIRVWGTSLLMFLSTVTAVGQTANRYLKAPLPQIGKRAGSISTDTSVMTIGGSHSKTPNWTL